MDTDVEVLKLFGVWSLFNFSEVSERHIKMTKKLLKESGGHIECQCFVIMPQIIFSIFRYCLPSKFVVRLV